MLLGSRIGFTTINQKSGLVYTLVDNSRVKVPAELITGTSFSNNVYADLGITYANVKKIEDFDGHFTQLVSCNQFTALDTVYFPEITTIASYGFGSGGRLTGNIIKHIYAPKLKTLSYMSICDVYELEDGDYPELTSI